jgi:hypothetical protein
MRYDTDIYYSSQNEPYEKARGYVVDEDSTFRIGFSAQEYGFEVKNENGKVWVIRKGEQAYEICLAKTPSSFTLKTPYGNLVYQTRLISFALDKKPNSYMLTLKYSLTDNSGHSQENVLKLRGMIK